MHQPSAEDLTGELNSLKRRWQRERAARLEAETIAERGLRELYDKKEQLQLLSAVSAAANESASVEETLRFTLTKLCESSGWSIGHAYMVMWIGDERKLVSTDIWSENEAERMQPFRAAAEAMTFAENGGLPEQVLSTGEAAWVSDLSADEYLQRAEAARQGGMRGGFAFPVVVGNQVAAVLEFFSERITVPDAFLLQLMVQVGIQLGRVVQRKHAEDKLIYEASHDSLTKLPNRAFFMDRLTRAIAHSKAFPNSAFAVLFVDLDRFKVINDSLGHNAGDALLIQVAVRILASLREEDLIVRGSAIHRIEMKTLARLGGDEFTILLDKLHHVSEVIKVAERVQHALSLPFLISDHEVYVGASVGVATNNRAYTSPVEVLHDADLAMYRAKSLGGSCCIMYDESMHAAGADNLQIEANLHRAIQNNEFVLHYQPIVELKSGELVGFEALVRWRRSESELVYPDVFIKIAEETGLIVPIGAWIMKEACTTARRWQEEFPRERPLTISINVSGRQLAQADLVEEVIQIVSETGIAPQTVCLEITESVTMGDVERTASVLSQLGTFGVRFSIDDFGTGFSSLSYLHRFKVGVLKIDRSFIARMKADVDSLAIVQTILNLARDLGMEVVAEGVETEAQAAKLNAFNCRFGQGYLFSRPLDPESARTFIQSAKISELNQFDNVAVASF